MSYKTLYRKAGRKALGLAVAIVAVIAIQHGAAAAQSSALKQSGTVTIDQAQIAFIFSGNVGGGKLNYGGKTYLFTIGGLGVGGFGISEINATGVVYNLNSLNDFAGAYGQARAGAVLGKKSVGTLWLENSKGVYLRLDAKRTGIMLSLGLDAIYIDFD